MVRHEEGFVIRAEEARRVRDNVDAFRGNVREDTLSNGVRAPGNRWTIVLDCVDNTVVLVGHPNLTAVEVGPWRPEAWRS